MTPKLKKILIISIPIAIVAIAAIVITVLLLGGGDDAYRTIKVYRTEGSSEVQRAGETMKPYENMLLENGDAIKTLENSYLYLKLDDDKFLMAEPSSSFKLVATGDSENSKTRIELTYGAVTIHITNPLPVGSTFEVGTGNSTMAVRGTSFRVSTDGEANEQAVVEVFEGEVSVQPSDVEGNAKGEPVSVTEGESALIAEEKVEKSEDGVQLPNLSVEVLEFLKQGIENGNDVGANRDEIDEIIANKQKTFTVTFTFEGKIFATERVAYGQTAKCPTLMPSPKGTWDFDFSTEITEDITICWIDAVEQ
jgi:hypothetical protein